MPSASKAASFSAFSLFFLDKRVRKMKAQVKDTRRHLRMDVNLDYSWKVFDLDARGRDSMALTVSVLRVEVDLRRSAVEKVRHGSNF